MNITCPQCRHEYTLPDQDVQGKKTYFYCDQCGHRVVIDRRTRAMSLKGSIGELWEAIPFSSSARLLFVAVSFIIITAVCIAIVAWIFRQNMEFFVSHKAVTAGLGMLVLSLLYIVFLVASYYMASFTIKRIQYPGEHSLSVVTPYFKRDFPKLLLLAAFPIILYVVMLPVAFLKTYGLIYAGVILPVLLPFIVIFGVFSASPQLTCAFIAYEHRSARDTVRNFFSFLLRENFTILLYLFFSRVISMLVMLVVGFLALGSISIFLGSTAILTDSSVYSLIPQYFSSVIAQLADPGTVVTGGFSPQVKLGLSILLAMAVMLFIIVFAIQMIIYQVLSTLSVYLMELNPKNSVTSSAMIIAGALAVLLLAASVFLHVPL